MPIFKAFKPFDLGDHLYESNHFRDELSLFLILTFFGFWMDSNSKPLPFFIP